MRWKGVHLGLCQRLPGTAGGQAGAWVLADEGTRAHLCSLLLAVGLLLHLLQPLSGPGELLLQQAPFCFLQRQGLA